MSNYAGITIDNSKESSTSGNWTNPGSALYDKIIDQKSALNEAYLIVEDGYKDAPSEHLKYPHHVIRSGKLIVHKDGVQAAFQRAKAQGITTGSVLNHIKKHYRELELDMTNFSIWEDKYTILWD
jgi:hypothetical protein